MAMHFGLVGRVGEQAEPAKQTLPAIQAELFEEGNGHMQMGLLPTKRVDICPSCGEASLVFEEGCKKCYGCGYSEC
jgi:ribonucleoside-diphosphate reductase alpha chain